MTSIAAGDAAYVTGGAGVAWRESGGEIVVLDLVTSMYFGLNPTAALLWKRLTTGATRTELVAIALERGAASTALADVDDFLAALAAEGLVART